MNFRSGAAAMLEKQADVLLTRSSVSLGFTLVHRAC